MTTLNELKRTADFKEWRRANPNADSYRYFTTLGQVIVPGHLLNIMTKARLAMDETGVSRDISDGVLKAMQAAPSWHKAMEILASTGYVQLITLDSEGRSQPVTDVWSIGLRSLEATTDGRRLRLVQLATADATAIASFEYYLDGERLGGFLLELDDGADSDDVFDRAWDIALGRLPAPLKAV